MLFVGTELMAFLLWSSQGQAGPPVSSTWSTERILARVHDHVEDAIKHTKHQLVSLGRGTSTFRAQGYPFPSGCVSSSCTNTHSEPCWEPLLVWRVHGGASIARREQESESQHSPSASLLGCSPALATSKTKHRGESQGT